MSQVLEEVCILSSPTHTTHPLPGKTSFLRLLLDTSDIAPSNSKEHLASVAKFVHGSSGHTSYFRTTSVDIDTDTGHFIGLNLVDSPSLDFRDDVVSERTITETLRLIDARFLEGLEDVSARTYLFLSYSLLLFS